MKLIGKYIFAALIVTILVAAGAAVSDAMSVPAGLGLLFIFPAIVTSSLFEEAKINWFRTFLIILFLGFTIFLMPSVVPVQYLEHSEFIGPAILFIALMAYAKYCVCRRETNQHNPKA